MTQPKSPVVTLNNGIAMPIFGLGVFQSPQEQTVAAVEAAIANGYRMIDTAAAYFNERQVGEGIVRSGISRSEIFVQTKLWLSNYGYDSTLRAFEVSLRKLGFEYVDLYLLHWPVPTDFEPTVASFKALEKLRADGQVRAIGVCNFNPKHLEDLIARTGVVPAVNQIELHPYLIQRKVRGAGARHGIVTQAWSPLGGVNVYWPDSGNRANPLEDPTILKLAQKYRKTPAQVVLRWHVEHGSSAIPKSVRRERIAENIDIFDFALTPDEVAAIDALDTGKRGGPDPELVDSKMFPVTIED